MLVVASWIFYQLKEWPLLVWRKFKYFVTYQVYFDDSNEFYFSFARWFTENYPQKVRNAEVRLAYGHESMGGSPVVETEEGVWSLKQFQFDDSNVIFYQNRWLWVQKSRKEMQVAGNGSSAFINSYIISGLFARSAIENLCQFILNQKIQSSKKTSLRVGINTSGGYFEWRDADIVKSLDHIFFAQKSELIDDLDTFVDRKEFYAQKGINFKRNYLFYGPAGTGKTSIASAMAKYLGYSLHVINLASVKDDLSLQRMGAQIKKKSVVLLEDIDCILSNRDVKSENLNFSTVLNFLDGLYAPSDCVFVMTTNHPEVLDDALMRKGRVDLALHVDFPSVVEVEKFMSDFYEVDVKLPVIAGSAKKGMAEVQDICLRNTVPVATEKVAELFRSTNGYAVAAK